MKNKRAWLILLAVAIALGLFANFALTRKDQPQYFTAKVERGTIRNVVDVTGTINAVTTVLVGSQVSGTIAKLGADFNSRVRKGDVIAVIDPALFEGALLQATADLESAKANVVAARANLDKARATQVQTKADYDRAIVLMAQDSVSKQALDLAKANYDVGRRLGESGCRSDHPSRSTGKPESGRRLRGAHESRLHGDPFTH